MTTLGRVALMASHDRNSCVRVATGKVLSAIGIAAALAVAPRAPAGGPGTVLHELTGEELARAKVDGLAADARGLALVAREGSVEGELDLAPFDRALVSANGELEGATLAISARVKLDDGTWTDWLELGVLGPPGDGVPRSEKAVPGPARVAVDVIELERPRGRALAWRAKLTRTGDGSARLRRVSVVAWERGSRSPPRRDHPAWGRVLDVPARSQ